ncbi:MAG TPA: aldo/keto reductase, partial [Thermoanaerobaculaceae bacterium]|nr:aldo/keto reductase [Thermoanaerobaculaceae bacterium]
MRAWQAPRYGGPEVLRLHDLPEPHPGPGEVVVRVRAIGLNFADCMARQGVYPQVPAPPFVPGMEVAGEVTAVGDGVADPRPGARVVAVPIFGGHAEAVRVQLEASLRAVRIDAIDLYQFHSGNDSLFLQEDLWEMLREQQRAGKIKHLGESITS